MLQPAKHAQQREGECWYSWSLPVLEILSPCAWYLDSILGYFPNCSAHGGGSVSRPVFTNQQALQFIEILQKQDVVLLDTIKLVTLAEKMPQTLF